MIKKITSVLMVAGLAACSQSTVFVGPDGQTARCASWGTGIAGASMANANQNNCEKDMRSVGKLPISEAGAVGITPSSDGNGLTILKVAPGSPAAQAGIQPGDVIVAVNGQKVANAKDARSLLFGRLGDPVELTYRSGKAERTVTILRGSFSGAQQSR